MKQPLIIGIAGLGTVGSGLLSLLDAHGSRLARTIGREIRIGGVSARSREKQRGSNLVESSDHHRDEVRCRANHCARETGDQCWACLNLGELNWGDLNWGEPDGRHHDADGQDDHRRGAGDLRLPRRLTDAGHPCGDPQNAERLNAIRPDGRD